MLRGKLDHLNARRDECLALDAGLGMDQPDLRQVLSRQQAVSVAANLKRRLLDAPRPLQKRYVHGLVSEIVVGPDSAVISGPSAAVGLAVSSPEQLAGVRSLVREWRSAQSRHHGAPRRPVRREQPFPDCAVEFPVYQGIYREFFRLEGLEARSPTKFQRKLRLL